jgi:Putative transposase/Transposase zinc-binding domain
MTIIFINDKKSFKNIFRDHWQKFKQMYPGYNDAHYDQTVQKMLGCGDESNGYTEYRCTTCGLDVRRIAFTCKSTFCLSCGKVYSDSFVSQVSKVLHPGVTYRHIVLTVPEQLRQFFYNNRKNKKLYSVLMRVGYQCLEDVVSSIRKQSVKIGAIAVIHTHGRSGSYNPHLHVIMTDGGINEKQGKWINLGYFPYEVLHKKWQYHLLSMLKEQFGDRVKELVDLLWKKYPQGFVGHVSKGKAPEHSKGLAKYLAKYVSSPPISIRRLIKYSSDTVSYYYKDHTTKKRKTETIPIETFIGRMVQHILPKGFQRIRYYGLQAIKPFNKWCDTIKEGLRKIGQVIKGSYQIVTLQNYRARYVETLGKDPCLCSSCGNAMELWHIWHPKYGLLYGSIGSG